LTPPPLKGSDILRPDGWKPQNLEREVSFRNLERQMSLRCSDHASQGLLAAGARSPRRAGTIHMDEKSMAEALSRSPSKLSRSPSGSPTNSPKTPKA
jgi:hypothetical protein